MPWFCPACQTAITHTEFEERPRSGVRYRCHVCRLELVLNESNQKLTVAPLLTIDDRDEKERK
jgi:hypothetical protein